MTDIKSIYNVVIYTSASETDTIKQALKQAAKARVSLYKANLEGADLRFAQIRNADLRDANMVGADMRWANLMGTDLRGADLSGADLRGAKIKLKIGNRTFKLEACDD